MKKVLALVLVLGMASLANAGLVISVGGVANPTAPIELKPSQEITLDIHSDGLDANPQPMALVLEGPGMFKSAGQFVGSVAGVSELYTDQADLLAFINDPVDGLGFNAMIVLYANYVMGGPGNLPVGPVVDGIVFHCEAPGDVLLSLVDFDTMEVVDTQLIRQIPEPMTMSLLALGGLGLLRRRR